MEKKSSSSIETSDDKRVKGQYFTLHSPFKHEAFIKWAEQFDINENILEPYAGANNLIWMLQEIGLAPTYTSFDIDPQEESVKYHDTISDFPTGYKVCVTNPPYLAKNSAKRRNIAIPNLGEYDNLWKLATALCLKNTEYVAAIIPESFITSGLFHERLQSVISITNKMFDDTDQPVCLALWGKEATTDFNVYRGEKNLGSYKAIKTKIHKLLKSGSSKTSNIKIIFNDPQGSLGLIAIDSTSGPGIKFVEGSTIDSSTIKVSSRYSTRITIENSNVSLEDLIKDLNTTLAKYRSLSEDVFLTSFRGIRKDGKFRRRIDWDTVRGMILSTLSK